MRTYDSQKNQKGAALVLVLLAFLVITILGTALVTVSLAEVKQATAVDRDMKAYYLARSAADATMKWIEDTIADINMMPITTEAEILAYEAAVDEFELVVPSAEGVYRQGNVSGIEGVDSVEIWRESGQIYVKATATVNGFSSSASVRLDQAASTEDYLEVTETVEVPEGSGPGDFVDALYATGDLRINGAATISGDVRYEETAHINGSWTITEGYFGPSEDTREFSWPPPEDLDTRIWPGNNTLNASHAGRYGTVTLISETVTINTQGQDVILHIGKLILNGAPTINVNGNGRLFLFLDDITSNGTLTLDSSANRNVYMILGDEVNEFKFNGSDRLEAYLFAPGSSLTFSGSATITGAIICADLRINGSVSLTYVSPENLSQIGGGSTGGETSTVTHTIYYTRIGDIGTNGKQWLNDSYNN